MAVRLTNKKLIGMGVIVLIVIAALAFVKSMLSGLIGAM